MTQLYQGSFLIYFLIMGIMCLYMLPGLIARFRGHHNVNAIAVLNFFLGWTALGWIGALVWAWSAVDRKSR